MLTIKRVPTVVSNYQENGSSDDLKSKPQFCGRNCLGNCCFPGIFYSPSKTISLFLFTFSVYCLLDNGEHCRVEPDEVDEHCDQHHPPMSFLNNTLLGQWEDRMSRGLFRYDVTSCESMVIPGKHGFIAQLNEGRHLKKRPTEIRVDKVLQPFDANKFNFTKVGQEEVLFKFGPSKDGRSHYYPSSPVDSEEGSPSVIAINVSPIEYGHVLLIPRVLDCLPQRIDGDSLCLAIHFAKEASDPHFRVGYNSLGAFATINHLHFQAYYLAVPFPLEKAPTRRIMSSNKGAYETRVVVSKLMDYPVRGFFFEGGHELRDLSDVVASSCIYLQSNNIPFNILISDCGRRVFLMPQCYAEKQARGEVSLELLSTQVNPAVWEISGHMVLKRKKDYDEASEECASRLLAEVSLSEERFQQVGRLVCEAANLQPDEEFWGIKEEENIYNNSTNPQHPPQDCFV